MQVKVHIGKPGTRDGSCLDWNPGLQYKSCLRHFE